MIRIRKSPHHNLPIPNRPQQSSACHSETNHNSCCHTATIITVCSQIRLVNSNSCDYDWNHEQADGRHPSTEDTRLGTIGEPSRETDWRHTAGDQRLPEGEGHSP